MPRIHIAATGASLCFFLAVTLGSAAAQSAVAGPVGKPLPLLQFTQHKSRPKLQPHPKLAATVVKKKKASRPRIAKRVIARPHRAVVDARPTPAAVASATAPDNTWPAASAATPITTATTTPTLTPNQPASTVTTEPTVDTAPNQIVAGSHAVQTALPDGLNGNGLNGAPPPLAAKKTIATASPAPTPVVRAMVVSAEPQNASAPNPIGSASWMAHMLAALGGAITAGAVAWFLIKPAPERTYG